MNLDTSPNARAQDLIGQVVDGRYRIERIVGRGGMGTVYACSHVVVGKAFAMKVLRPGIERSEEILQRFIREAQAANAVRSRHICEMSDFGQLSNGAFYVVMELLQGISLTRALREKRLDRPTIKRVFSQIAATLEQAHRAGIIHRDMKPDNVVLVEQDGDPFFVKLVDFGIAKMTQAKASNLTETGVILGTPYYMSPEQARGEALDHRSDIYAVGVMMYRAFTGRLPFVADTAMGVLTRHLTEKPELPSRLAEIDGALERLILRCLEKKPIDRFQSMSDLEVALQSVPDYPRKAQQHRTIDERTGGLAAAEARRDQPTPTRVATPHARSQRLSAHTGPRTPSSMAAGHGVRNVHEVHGVPSDVPTRPEGRTGQGAAHGGSMPPPMPAPPPPSAPTRVATPLPVSGHAAHQSGSVPAQIRPPHISAMSSGSHPMSTGAPLATDIPLHLQGEAATGRAVVSSQLVRPRRARNAAVLGGVAAAFVLAGAIGAITILSGGEAPPAPAATSEPETAAETTGEIADETAETSSETTPETTAEPAASSEPEPETSATTETETDKPRPVRVVPRSKGKTAKSPPQPKSEDKAKAKTEEPPEDDGSLPPPEPEIRSPFED